MNAPIHLSDTETDILTEIASIGANHAAGALSKMIQQRVDVEVPVLELTAIEHVRELIGHAEQGMTGVTIAIKGDVNGIVFLLFAPEEAHQLVTGIAKGQETSALEEVANVITGTALGSLQRFLGLKLFQTVPGSASDMLGAVVNDTVADVGNRADSILMLGIQFLTGASHVSGQLFFMFDPESTQKILSASQQKAGV